MYLIPIAVIVVVLLAMGIRIAQEYQRAIVFRLGRYHATKGPGLYFIIPFIDSQMKGGYPYPNC
jgi:regulator of protease activity HflC (stomatin/prohibitin superfamily)